MKLETIMKARERELREDGIDADHLAERLALEERLYSLSLTALLSEYHRTVYRQIEGWEWRAVSHVANDRLRRLERKDHTRAR